MCTIINFFYFVMLLALVLPAVSLFGSANNYISILRHGSMAGCPCFRIPSLVATGPSSLVLLVEARWSSSECYPVHRFAVDRAPNRAPSLALVSSSDGGRSFDKNLTIIEAAKCGGTCNPHATWSQNSKKLVVVFRGADGMSTISTTDPFGHTGWSKPASLTPFVGPEWSKKSLPGPGAALTVQLPGAMGGSERLLFCAHAGAYKQDVAFFSDDGGTTFNVSSSTPFNAPHNVLKGMDECSLAQLSNGSVVMVLRNFGGFPEHDPRGLHNPRCADKGICKAFSRSDDLGVTWSVA